MQNAAISAVLPVYSPPDLDFVRGEGAYLFTADGRRYLDFASGIAVASLGHCHPHLMQALTEQAGKVWHLSNLFRIGPQNQLAERLVANSFAETVFFANSGAEALECAIKMARRYHWARGEGGRYRIVTFRGAFHGRTIATISAGGQAKYLEGFTPGVVGFDQIGVGDLNALAGVVGRETAAILIEPIQGEGGIRAIPPEFLQALRRVCDEQGPLLIFDEVQTGMGRTGTLFAYEQLGVTPDIMALAKGLGGGFPIGACLATARAASGMAKGVHGSTFGGNPLACAVGNAVLDVLLAPGFLDHVRALAAALHDGLERAHTAHPDIVEAIRGRGLLLGLKLGPNNADFAAALREAGLLTVPAGDNVLRLLPPLIIEQRQVDEALEALGKVCRGGLRAAA
jgi:acetylornithine/N-succinyldiaminopimelate aminotransferase